MGGIFYNLSWSGHIAIVEKIQGYEEIANMWELKLVVIPKMSFVDCKLQNYVKVILLTYPAKASTIQ